MKQLIMTLVLVFCLSAVSHAADCTATYGTGDTVYRVATGSPGELGLLEALATDFTAEHNATLCWKKAGSGKSLQLLKDGKVDIVMVHAPAAEKKAVAEGWAEMRTLIGSNEFYIVGPESDPAAVGKAKTVAEAYSRIARNNALFFSRGDNSGTHKKELGIWKKAGITPAGQWYRTTKDFMQATLLKADAEQGYFMTDSSTWVATQQQLSKLVVLFRGDPVLINTYHALIRPDAPNTMLAKKFISHLKGAGGQSIIGEYGTKRFGNPMYNDAAYAAQYDH